MKPASSLVERLVHVRRERHFPFRDYHKRHGCVFIHVPKTAGTSVLRALGHGRTGRLPGQAARTSGRDHLPWFVYQTANPEYYARAFSFAFVRNPWDRALSAYRHVLRETEGAGKVPGGGRVDGQAGGGAADEQPETIAADVRSYTSFTDFVRRGLAEGHFRSHLMFLPQSFFVLGANGEPAVDFVGRFEQIDQDFAEVAARLGLLAELPRENVGDAGRTDGAAEPGSGADRAATSEPAYRAAYQDPAAVDIVAEIYREDVRAFGYTF